MELIKDNISPKDEGMREGLAKRADLYEPVAAAIDYLAAHSEQQPDLETLAAAAGMSPSHFQRVFQEGAGVSPKRFLQYVVSERAKAALKEGASVLDAAYQSGLSGPSRLHDLFLVCEAMTPGAYKKKGAGLLIRHAFAVGPFGVTLIGATDKGICWLSFASSDAADQRAAVTEMKGDWPAAEFVEDAAYIAPLAQAAFAFAKGEQLRAPLGLHVRGSNFQLKVWRALLDIPLDAVVTYGDIADVVCTRKASRAVGAAVGANMVSLLIPCHRVILSSGAIHNYRWGVGRKKALLALEAGLSEQP